MARVSIIVLVYYSGVLNIEISFIADVSIQDVCLRNFYYRYFYYRTYLLQEVYLICGVY